jgi:hypothetical protein
MTRPQLIVSASRRTDLPGFHSHWTAEKIRRLRRPIHSVFFWTKHPSAFAAAGPLRDLVENELASPLLLVTVTGLGGTRLEPNVPAWRDAVKAMKEVLRVFRGEPGRLRWRFDPVLPGVGAPALFASLAPRFLELGIDHCIISLPAAASLKGNLLGQYGASAVGTWTEPAARSAIEEILRTAERLPMRVLSCATRLLVEWFPGRIEPATCIDAALASRMHPERIPVEHVKDPAQRKHCGCSVSEDIGSYSETLCRSGCLYCYSKAGGPLA